VSFCWGSDDAGQSSRQATITSDALPALAILGTPFDHPFTAEPADVGLWSVTSGALPPGLELDPSSGRLHGTPTTSGTYAFRASVDGVLLVDVFDPAVTTQDVTITVAAAPMITGIDDVTITEGSSTDALDFLVGDHDTHYDDLTVTATSADQDLVADEDLMLTGTLMSRSLTATPVPGATGTTTVTVTVTDPQGLSASTSFELTVVAPSSSVGGTVRTTGGDPVAGALVAAYADTDGFWPTAFATTSPTGTWTLIGLPVGTYRFAFVPSSGAGLLASWHGPSDTRAAALPVTVPTTGTLDGIDGTLSAAATISGTVTGPDGQPVEGATVRAYAESDAWFPTSGAATGPDGAYELTLPAGTYRIHVTPAASSALRPSWIGGDTRIAATAHPLAEEESRAGVDATLAATTSVTGTVVDEAGDPVAGTTVAAWRPGAFLPSAETTTDADGTYQLVGVAPGDHLISFSPPPATGLATTWWNQSPTRSGATTVAIDVDAPTTGIDATLAP
jgi:protocatechuate 3,4-dioxygenase beta subunit